MKAFSDGKFNDRQHAHRAAQQAPGKEIEAIELPEWNPEELHRTQGLIQDLDKQFARLRETLHGRHLRISRAKQLLSGLQLLLFPPRHPWWRRWFPW